MSGLEIGAVLGGGGAILGGVGALVNNENYITPSPNVPWYDFLNEYSDFTEEYTNKIDQILLNTDRSYIQYRLILPGNRIVPNVGYHKWYDYRTKQTIKLAKNNYADKGELPKYYYTLIYSNNIFSNQTKLANYFINQVVFKEHKDSIGVIRFENTDGNCKPIIVNTLYMSPKPNQMQAIEIISNEYTNNQIRNVKTILCGSSGIGKTYTSVLLKRHLETQLSSINFQLFENFDPSIPGYDINKHVLQHATEQSPIILVINEIDKLYDEIHENNQVFDPRIPHTKNKISFNNMLDNIANTKHVITIFTTEKSAEELQSEERNYPFYRPGRVDYFINMDAFNSQQVLHLSK